MKLLAFDNFKDIHRARFGADAAGNTFGRAVLVFSFNDKAERTNFNTFTTVCTKLFVDHVDTLRILRDCAGFAVFSAFAALYTDFGF